MTTHRFMVLRCGVGAVGLSAMGFGAVQLVTDPGVAGWTGVLEWLAAAVVLHDGVLVPLVLCLGALLGARLRRRLRWAFVVAGSLTAAALPVLLAPGPAANPSVRPLDYPRNWAVCVLVVGAAAVAWEAWRWAAARRRRR
ncbi:hypothetical protein [Actinacidiphila paucisporea]|uniref:Uncharacterized protein n=1 Tax=Actinacidiphila paucisporea TaxID=310782 RepID=A0A1M7JXA9_9ACTN|nr:hypothetical protein [Actinacidiphila paucisporea]SHM57177.1 hypothetical protein SAMN05216499_11264 [Actinacidiphila paucisporea]